MSRTTEEVEFSGADGSRLAGRLDLPVARTRAVALFAHCFTCSKDIFAATRISAGLADLGIAVLRFDFTGLGSSPGNFADTNFSSNVDDLLAAAAFLRRTVGAPSLLVGHSLGGAAVLAATSEVPECRAVVTIGAPADPRDVHHLFDAAVPDIEANGSACVRIAGRPFTIKRQFLDDIGRHRLQDKLARLGRALLVLHSPGDEIVGIDNARIIFDAAKHPKSFVSLDRADHLLTDRADAGYVASVVAAWVGPYVEPREQPLRAGSPRHEGSGSGNVPQRSRIPWDEHATVSRWREGQTT